jgi:hypothetical protein
MNERVVVVRVRPQPDPSPWERLDASLQSEPPTLPDAIVVDVLEVYAGLLEDLAKDLRSEAAGLSHQDAISPADRKAS